MPEFGDELIIESYKVPWLIWIQLLVTVLLIIILFFGFSVFASDPSHSSSTASPSTGSAATDPPTNLNRPRSCPTRTKVENRRVRGDEETSGVSEADQTGEESSTKDANFFRIFQHPNHPCNYIEQVKRAFLKCLGLDSCSDSHQHEKQE